MKFERKWLVGALIVAVVAVPLAVRGCRGDSAKQLDLVKVEERGIHPTILAPGILAYRNEVNLTSELTGRVATIGIKEGDSVEKGQLLLTLDPEIYRNAVDRAEAGVRQGRITIDQQRAALALRQKQFDRARVLVAQRLIDQGSFDQSQNDLKVASLALATSQEDYSRAQSALQDAREQLAKTDIRSPISGRIVSLPIKVGETAVPSTSSFVGAQLATIADTSRIQAELKVDEADIARVAIGESADVYAAAFPDTALKGTVEQIALAPTVEGQARAYKVTVALTVPGNIDLRSGMSVRAEIVLGKGGKQAAVPVEAIVGDGGDAAKSGGEAKQPAQYVWKIEDGIAHKVKVETGLSDDAWQAVGKPLKVGDTVARGPSRQLQQLQEGDRVQQRKADADKPGDDKSGDSKSE
ncbi:MAG TPA: efflux RND transporter periplasmic adaptor subunit [Luteimonas sp.]|jgi:HlyD family secretion protein|nr:efflux RND transporter periplasmic adaptor subunit [Luteimonas sp.]